MTFEIHNTDSSQQSLQHWSDVEKNEICGYNPNNNPQRSDFSVELLRYFFHEFIESVKRNLQILLIVFHSSLALSCALHSYGYAPYKIEPKRNKILHNSKIPIPLNRLCGKKVAKNRG